MFFVRSKYLSWSWVVAVRGLLSASLFGPQLLSDHQAHSQTLINRMHLCMCCTARFPCCTLFRNYSGVSTLTVCGLLICVTFCEMLEFRCWGFVCFSSVGFLSWSGVFQRPDYRYYPGLLVWIAVALFIECKIDIKNPPYYQVDILACIRGSVQRTFRWLLRFSAVWITLNRI